MDAKALLDQVRAHSAAGDVAALLADLELCQGADAPDVWAAFDAFLAKPADGDKAAQRQLMQLRTKVRRAKGAKSEPAAKASPAAKPKASPARSPAAAPSQEAKADDGFESVVSKKDKKAQRQKEADAPKADTSPKKAPGKSPAVAKAASPGKPAAGGQTPSAAAVPRDPQNPWGKSPGVAQKASPAAAPSATLPAGALAGSQSPAKGKGKRGGQTPGGAQSVRSRKSGSSPMLGSSVLHQDYTKPLAGIVSDGELVAWAPGEQPRSAEPSPALGPAAWKPQRAGSGSGTPLQASATPFVPSGASPPVAAATGASGPSASPTFTPVGSPLFPPTPSQGSAAPELQLEQPFYALGPVGEQGWQPQPGYPQQGWEPQYGAPQMQWGGPPKGKGKGKGKGKRGKQPCYDFETRQFCPRGEKCWAEHPRGVLWYGGWLKLADTGCPEVPAEK